MGKMATKSIYIDEAIWDKSIKASDSASVSQIVSMLLSKWLAGEINLTIQPVFNCPECGSPNFDHIGGSNYRCEKCGHHFAF